jgi:hypothetical protein
MESFNGWRCDFSCDPAARASDFREFESEDQFLVASSEPANIAATEAVRLREAFRVFLQLPKI